MTEFSSSRRQALKQLASMTAVGAVMALRAPKALAAKTPRLSIPGVAGKVIRRQDVDYELWREAMVWHMSKPKRYPDMIVQAKSAEDVIGAVNYARENKLKSGRPSWRPQFERLVGTRWRRADRPVGYGRHRDR